jgi:hypothetical protein
MVRMSALRTDRSVLVLISVRGWVDPRAIVRLEGLGQLKKSNDLTGSRTRDLPACSIVPQPTTLRRYGLPLCGYVTYTSIMKHMLLLRAVCKTLFDILDIWNESKVCLKQRVSWGHGTSLWVRRHLSRLYLTPEKCVNLLLTGAAKCRSWEREVTELQSDMAQIQNRSKVFVHAGLLTTSIVQFSNVHSHLLIVSSTRST